MEKKVYKYKWDNPTQIRKSLSAIANKVLSGEIETTKANCIVAITNSILSSIKTFELESKIDELEKLLEDRA